MNQYHLEEIHSTKRGFLFTIFCVWAFVLLSRPQDIFTFMAPLRPALTLGIVVFFVFLLKNPGSASRTSFNNPQIKLYTALVCVMIISVPFAYYRRGAFMEIFTKYASVVLFFFIFFKVVDSTEKINRILFISCLGAGLYSVFALTKGISAENRLFFGNTFDPNDFSFFTLSFFPYNFLFLSRENSVVKRLICIGNLVAGAILILMTGSRGGFIAFSVVIFMLFLTKTHSIKFLYKIVLVVLCLAAVSLNPSKIDFERYKTIGNLEEDYNLTSEEGRWSVWKIGLKIMLSHPLTGVGVNCFNEAIGRDRDERGLDRSYWQAPHNMLIQIGSETGVIGLVLFGLLSFRAFRIFGRVKKGARSEKLVKIGEMAGVGFAGHFISGMFVSQAYSIYWGFYMALSAVLPGLMREDR